MAKMYQFPCGCRWPMAEENPPDGVLPLLHMDVELAPTDCPATWAMLGKGLAKGVFQLESPLGRQWVKKLKPQSLEHMGALGAILRPGALKNVDSDGISTTMHYCLRKNGLEEVPKYHPAVDPILSSTYLSMIYQEQAMAIAVAVAGFDEKAADSLRKSIGKKLPEEMAKCKTMFLEGAKAAGVVTEEQAAEIFGWIEKSQRYSFNKCASEHERIRRPGASKNASESPYTIGEMYRIRNDIEYAKATGHEQLRRKWKRLGNYGKGLSMCEDGRIRPNIIVDIQPASRQPVLRVLVGDRTIDVTANHKFPTPSGFKTAGELVVGDELFVCGKYEPTDFKKYKFSNTTNADRLSRKGGSGSGVFGEDNRWFTNGSYTDFVKNGAIIPMECGHCHKTTGRLELHHKDGNRCDSSMGNLIRLCASCHKKSEYAAGRTRKGEKGYPSLTEKVTAITELGEVETYDVTMDAPNHNFVVASGIVACNSHAMCYGVTGYHSAYLKAHCPLAFFAAWLKNAKHKKSGDGPLQEVKELVNDARLFDVVVEPPDLRSMEFDYHTDRKVVRVGLGNIRGIGEEQVKKIKAAVAAAEQTIGKPVARWDWYDLLTHFADLVSSTAILHLIQAGALRWVGASRALLEAECKVWLELTDAERRWVREQGGDAFGRSLVAALRALANPKKRPPDRVDAVVPKKGQEARVAALEAEYPLLKTDEERALNRAEYEKRTKTVKVDVPGTGYDGPAGGCSTDARRRTVLSHAQMLENPASPRVDSPLHISWLEEQLLGISLTCSPVDSCDLSEVNCSCKEFLAGRTGFMLLGVVVGDDVRTYKTKSGANPGSPYGRMTISDGTCQLEAVCWPNEWKTCAQTLNAPKSRVIVQVERDFKDPDSSMAIVRKAWPAKQTM